MTTPTGVLADVQAFFVKALVVVLVVVGLVVGAITTWDHRRNAALEERARVALDSAARETHRADSLGVIASGAERRADSLGSVATHDSIAAVHVSDRAHQVAATIHVLRPTEIPPDATLLLPGDTVQLVMVQRPIDDRPHTVPAFVIDALNLSLTALDTMTQYARTEHAARVLTDSALVGRDSEVGALHRAHVSDSTAIGLLLARRDPPCGFRCAATIGGVAVGTAILAAKPLLVAIARAFRHPP